LFDCLNFFASGETIFRLLRKDFSLLAKEFFASGEVVSRDRSFADEDDTSEKIYQK
jgi:hypothetical protein